MNDWRETARCKDADPNLFFPDGKTGEWLMVIEAAKGVCRRCGVSDDCLQYALDTNQEHGIWGGLTGEERRALRRRPEPAPNPAPELLPERVFHISGQMPAR